MNVESFQRAEEGLRSRLGIASADRLRFVFSPYRICPLGAHVDHQDGVVTGMAIDQGVVVAFAPREDTLVRAASANFPGEVRFDLTAAPPAQPGDWGNFLRGAAVALTEQTKAGRPGLTRGADLFVVGQLPVGGLSSSAAVSVGYLLALEAANDLDVSPEENVRLARAIENDYVGLRSGILDQSMILLSQQDHLLRLDCRTGARDYAAFASSTQHSALSTQHSPAAVAVAYSGVSQALVGTGYNQRVGECHDAAARLLALAGLPAPAGGARLRDVPAEVYETHRAGLPPHLARRAAHYFGEQARVAEGVSAWDEGDAARFGQLVTDSGRSSIENYECGAPELIAIYEALVASPGVYGARFSGAGFRGSCLALVEPPAFPSVGERVRAAYAGAFPQHAERFGFFPCASGPAAHLLE